MEAVEVFQRPHGNRGVIAVLKVPEMRTSERVVPMPFGLFQMRMSKERKSLTDSRSVRPSVRLREKGFWLLVARYGATRGGHIIGSRVEETDLAQPPPFC